MGQQCSSPYVEPLGQLGFGFRPVEVQGKSRIGTNVFLNLSEADFDLFVRQAFPKLGDTPVTFHRASSTKKLTKLEANPC